MTSKRELFDRVVEELNLDTSDPFTLIFANACALTDQVDELKRALVAIDKALCTDARQKSITGDSVEYHLDGQTMGYALNLARDSLHSLGEIE